MYYIKMISYHFQPQFIHKTPTCYSRDGHHYELYSSTFIVMYDYDFNMQVRNNSMFKGRNPCPKIIHLKEGISKNNTKLKPKNGYANINIDEEDIPENIKNNKLARFCASINQIFNVDPLDYDYEDNYTDGLEKIIKNKNLNDISFDFENPSIRITRNTRKQKQIESNNLKNDTTKNNIRCSSFKIKTFNQVHDEMLPKEQNLIVSKKEKNDGQVNESSLLPNTDKEKNTSAINTNQKINNKTINTRKTKNSLISDIILDKITLTSNTHEKINTLTTNTYIPKEKIALISNINNDKNTLTSNTHGDENTLTSNTHKDINILTTNTCTPKEKKSSISNIKKDKNKLISNINNYSNTVTSNSHEEINTSTTYTHTPKEKIALISNINKDKNTLSSNTHGDENTLTSNTHKDINTLTNNTHTPKEKKSSISNIKKDKSNLIRNINNYRNTVTSNSHEEINASTTNTHTPRGKISLISNINKDKNTLSSNTHEEKNTLTTKTTKKKDSLIRALKKKNSFGNNIRKNKITSISNISKNKSVTSRKSYKIKNILTTNKQTTKRTLVTNTHKKINIRTTNKQKTKSSLIINTRRKKMYSKLKKKTLKPTNQNSLEMKSTSIILAPTIKTTSSILTSTIKIKPPIRSCMNNAINYEDDISINSDSDSYYDNEEPNHNITNDVNLVHDDMISIYCKENWPTILNNLSDPLTGIEVYRSILFNKACILLQNQCTKTKLEILKLKGRNLQWQLKFECLEFQIKTLVESTRSDRNTRHISIQNQNQKDAALCRSIGVGKKETTNAGRKKKVCTDLKNDITPDNFKTLKSYQQSLNSEDGNLTECETDINTTKSKEIKTNLSSTQVMVDLIKDIPPSTTASILIPESSESKKRSVSECDTYITRSKTKIIKTNHSSIPNFDNLNVHIPPETTISIISPESIYTEQDNLTQSDSGIEITKSKVIETNEQSTLESSNICPDFAILTQYGTEIEFSEITESNMIDCYEPATSASIDRTVNNPPVITTSGLSSYLFSNQKTISTQYNTDIRKTRSKTMESSPAYIDLTVDSPPDMISSSVNPNMLNGQSSSTLHNTQIECYEPSTSTSIDLTVNDLPIMMNSMLKNKTNIFTQCNKDIEITSLTSMSTDLRSNNPTFSSSSVKATTPLNSNDDLCMDGESKVKKRTTFDVFVVGKDAQLSTVDAKRIKRIDWKCPQALFVSSNQIPVELSHQNAILPVALKRINENPPSQYPLLNMLLTKPNNTVIKPAEINTTPFNNQMNTPFPPKNTIIKQDKRTFILNIPVNSVNNRMKAPLPDVVYESTQITNKINYQETIHSNYSYNLRKAAHKMKPVPIAIPLPPSEIIYGYSDEI
ncbi:uncharacterized protein LOC111028074 isoform X2 [Myzus persicae]|uniref:uncharacterized protein LOC111028074 isoform X2 n=1 Tax=Myzus persicae TaxID=13164 RepID=UPI000B92F9EB|nr:uncharacterized protein LOC111028074 isoform X2 [Myzus persicae]